ncbi:methyltransferase domain-containing protein [Actinoplanes sp. NPDC049596]|uniref:class I SAM-dependent methyltransferase n=1 Tax=unclassified Actinoplanes TaxID=2626549 RepID=UPI003429AD47
MTSSPGRLFDEVPELYDRARPAYPGQVFTDLAALVPGRSALEIGCGTGQATRALAARGWSVVALEPGPALAALARRNLAAFPNVTVENATFEEWDPRGRHFDVVVAASSWHWVDPVIGPPRAAALADHLALIDNTVVRRPGEPEMYALTADLHERYSPGNPAWGHPPLEADVLAQPGRWYPHVQWLAGPAMADLLRTQSICRSLTPDVREPLLDAIAARITEPIPRRYLCSLRL